MEGPLFTLPCRSLIDPNLSYINPVNMPHPLLDVVITGSSGSLFCWRPEVSFWLSCAYMQKNVMSSNERPSNAHVS
jgi:hypothetical protein